VSNVNAAVKDGKIVIEIDVSDADLQQGAARSDTVDRELATTGGFVSLGSGLRLSLKVTGRCRKI
jgi:hypothetical protein